MQFNIPKVFITAALLIIGISFYSYAQESSIYSRYGLGLLSDHNSIASRSMGGLNSVYNSYEHINFSNPASYSSLRLISADIGLGGYFNSINDGTRKQTARSIDIAYFQFSVPVNKHWGSSIGLMPFTAKSYSIIDTLSFNNGESSVNEVEGFGNTYIAYWGNGFEFKGVSVGFNFGYHFGRSNTNSIAYLLDDEDFLDPYSFVTWQKKSLRVSGLYWNVGAQYRAEFNDKLSLTTGISGNKGVQLQRNSNFDDFQYSFYGAEIVRRGENQNLDDFLTGVSGAILDTLTFNTQPAGLVTPSRVNVGLMLESEDYWKVGVDFGYNKFKASTEPLAGVPQIDGNGWKFSLGGEFFPVGSKSSTVKSKFLSQLKYRAGFRYEKTPYIINSQQINEFGINFGLGIPVLKRLESEQGFIELKGLHSFNVGFEVGSRGTTQNNLVRENFFRMNFSLSLNDRWFVKRKYY